MKFKRSEPSPRKFEQVNFTYTIPKGLKGEVGSLPCYRAPNVAVSCWRFPLRARIRFLFTGDIWFVAVANGHPPIGLTVYEPDEINPEPVPASSDR